MAGNNGYHAKRCTILMDERVYIESKSAALHKHMKLYEYINYILAKAVSVELSGDLKHAPIKKKKEDQESVSGGSV